MTPIDHQAAFEAIVRDPRYLANLDWGDPRPGHPEGTVRAHIDELERNLATLSPKLRDGDVPKLRLLIHVHDTFKGAASTGVGIFDPRSHASLARTFLAEFCPDGDLLEMTQRHDEPYALWRRFDSRGAVDADRLAALVRSIRDWRLFAAFLILDGCTEGKSHAPLEWFLPMIGREVECGFNVGDLI